MKQTGIADGFGKPFRDPLPIPVRLGIVRIDQNGELPIFDGVSHRQRLEGWRADSFSTVIARVELDPGTYDVGLEALTNIEAIDDIEVYLNVHVRQVK